jgi:hypothetical protein
VSVDLSILVARLATRDQFRTEADIQSDIQTVLLHGGLNLSDPQVSLESQLQDGTRRRIDGENGATVFEVKKSLQNADAVTGFEDQLAGYVRTRSLQTGARYVGILTDGTEWRLYSDRGETFTEINRITLASRDADIAERLTTWLEAVMATSTNLKPTPVAIKTKLGDESPSFALDIADITAMYESISNTPELKLKRSLWAKLLTTALGTQFTDETSLFIEHTYLVLIAEVVAHAVVGFDLNDESITPATIVSGGAFAVSQISGVVEQDFFDWILDAPDGAKFVRRLARRVARFDWSEPEHDVLKVLYESVIDTETRHSLGEYYTPDWMADRIVREAVTDPLNQKVLDPSCGSGTFVFHAVRKYLAAADDLSTPNHQSVTAVTRMVTGMDLHPVAVTLARVTYLLAIGSRRIQDQSREAIAIPVYLGDSLQWEQTTNTMTFGDLIIPTGEGSSLFDRELRFPARATHDASMFDRLVERLSTMANTRAPGSPIPNLEAVFAHFAIHPDDQAEISETFTTLCQLSDEGRDHIWSYYVRNTARPVWLAQPENHVDVLVGNPPWLSYRYMPKMMQAKFKTEATARGLWAGGKVATHQDLSAFFVARAVELYLKPGGKFSFVMPHAVLSRIQYAGFRSGIFEPPATGDGTRSRLLEGGSDSVSFTEPWDFIDVRPHPFPVPSCAVFGTFTRGVAGPMPAATIRWGGRLPSVTVPWDTAKGSLTTSAGAIRVVDQDEDTSPYKERFAQGATLVPRVLLMVNVESGGPLGVGAGRVSVKSARSTQEKKPWKDLEPLVGTVEREFLFEVLLGSSIGPYRVFDASQAIIPLSRGEFLSATGAAAPIDHYAGLANWYRQAVALWDANSSGNMTLEERWNFQRGVTRQFPPAPYRVVYTKSGSILAAAIVTNERAVIDHKLYWANTASLSEARYLTGVLNSATLLDSVRGLQSQGLFGARDFDTYVFHANYGLFEPSNELHSRLVRLVERAEVVAADVSVDSAKSFQTARKAIRNALTAEGVAGDIDLLVGEILNSKLSN